MNNIGLRCENYKRDDTYFTIYSSDCCWINSLDNGCSR